jgi:hypothetical protein
MYKYLICPNCNFNLNQSNGYVTECDNSCNTYQCKCGKEFYIQDYQDYQVDPNKVYNIVIGHNPKCGEDESCEDDSE